jgi:hypothetical protein
MATSLRPLWPTAPGSIFFADVASQATLKRAVDQRRIRKLSRGLYTADMSAVAADLVERHRFRILAYLLPDAILLDRTAANGGLVTGGRMFVGSVSRTANISLPGLEVIVRHAEPLAGRVPDPPWTSGLRISSDPRTLLDNLTPSRARKGVARTLNAAELEDWLAKKMLAWGQDRFERLRSSALEVAAELDAEDRIEHINQMFGAIRNTGPARRDASPLVAAIRRGAARDSERVEAFATLADQLRNPPGAGLDEPEFLPEPIAIGELPFWEAYFSNFIEGTEFTVDEARQIVESRRVPVNRPADGHDILGTYHCIADPVGRAHTSVDPLELISLLRARHASMLEGRPEIRPGEWKATPNQVGSYMFVEPTLVEGTLLEGFSLIEGLKPGFMRALYLMFVVSETHPFTDGNGRAARVMANAELSAVHESRVVVPIVFRNEYLSGLRKLSRTGDATAYRRILSFAWRWTAAMPWWDHASCDGKMAATNALIDSNEAGERGIALELP